MNSDCKFFVFREGRRSVAGEQLLGGLRGSLARAADANGWIDALLRAGELECGLEDAGSDEAERAARVTDACAKKLVSWSYRTDLSLLPDLPLRIVGELTVSTPEGFAYYALHPRVYAEVVERLVPQVGESQSQHQVQNPHPPFGKGGAPTLSSPQVLVIGIRSIGTTLSAMTVAGFKRAGVRAERFTVRPTGHPFDRKMEWTRVQRHKIHDGREDRALFVIVDEGPGLSGSSFLSVAEALCAQGVRRERIVLVPSHAVNVSALRAKNGAKRWRQFQCVELPEGKYPEGEWIGGGEWRQKFVEGEWPGAWTTLERPKFLSEGVVWKFEGLGPYGSRARVQAVAIAKNGFGPKVVGDEHGYIGYELVPGRAARREDLNEERLKRIAEYCAFRAEEFRCVVGDEQRKEFATMLRLNFEREFETRWPAGQLEVVRTTVCDGRMGPREWIVAEDARLVKVDATSHGDGHFFPGPCDIAWDLAGAIAEWEMDAAMQEELLREYAALTHDAVAKRVKKYVFGYAVFRNAWCRMAAAGMKGTADEERLMREAQRYRAYVERMFTVAAAAGPAARAS